MDTNIIPSEHMDRWKSKFNSLNTPNQIGLGLMVNWAREASCSQDHKLIANCLSFMDSKAQVSITTLTPNILYYLPTPYHFVEHKIRDHSHETLMHIHNTRPVDHKDHSDVKDSDISVYSSPIQNIEYEVEGSHSFISTTHNPSTDIAGKYKKDDILNSPSPSQEAVQGVEVVVGENFKINSMEIDRNPLE